MNSRKVIRLTNPPATDRGREEEPPSLPPSPETPQRAALEPGSVRIKKTTQEAEFRTESAARKVPLPYPPAGMGGSAGKKVLDRWMPTPPGIDWEGKNRKTVRSGRRPTIYCQWIGDQASGSRGRQIGQFNPDEITTLDSMSEPERSEWILERIERWKAEKGIEQ